MTLLLLIRHATTEVTGSRLAGRAPGLHLSDRGRDEAGRLAERLRPVPLAALYSSPLERCMETAGPIAEGRRLSVEPLPGVLEVAYGRWTGRSFAQLARTGLWKRVQLAPSGVRFPDGESLAEVQRRSVEALEAVAARHAASTVAVVTHAEVIRLAVAHYAGVHLDLFQRLVVSPASVTAVALGDGIPRILRMNDTGTLQDLAGRPRHRRAVARAGRRAAGAAPRAGRRGPGGSPPRGSARR